MAGLKGNVLITGGGQRLGLYHARQFIEAGYQVIVTYRNERPGVAELARLGALTIQADFATMAGIERCIATLRGATASLRAIIHNASAWLTDEEVMTDPRLFTELANVHMLTPYLFNLRCHDLLLADQPSPLRDIVHMTDFAIQKGSAKHAAYVATKAGLESLALSFAKRFAPRIKVNAIAPALIKFNAGDSQAYRQKTLKKSVLQIEPGEPVIWQTLEFILANPYLTGAIIPMDGGRHLV
ncbi:MAG: dihydromonapterin reductase [Gammaproteobacteria bacterium]